MAEKFLEKILVQGPDGVDVAVIKADQVKNAAGESMETVSTGLKALRDAVNTFLQGPADGGDLDRLFELVAAIGANKDSIDALVSDKIAKSDIVDNLTTIDATKPLSAAQGKALKQLVDAISAKGNGIYTVASIEDAIALGAQVGTVFFVMGSSAS